MKKWSILLLVALAGLVVLAGCQNNYLTASDLAGYTKTSDCMACHNGATYPVPAAKAGYAFSGHFSGTRTYAQAEGSWQMENSGSVAAGEGANTSCAKCHTDEGFKAWLGSASHPMYTTATSAVDQYNSAPVGGASPGCFTCHDPHTNKNMNLRTEAAVNISSGLTYTTLASSTTPTITGLAFAYTYDGGAGNLCANCHQDRRGAKDSLNPAIGKDSSTATAAGTSTGNSRYLHQGPQADFLLGVDNAGVSQSTTDVDHLNAAVKTNGYTLAAGQGFAVSKHYSITDSCVNCHVTLNDMAKANISGDVSSHGMYLTNGTKDNVGVCLTCHSTDSGISTTATTFRGLWTSGAKFTLFASIDAAEKTLLTYFGNPTNFYKSDITTKTTARTLVYPLVKFAAGDAATTVYAGPVIRSNNNGSPVSLTDASGNFVAGDYSYTPGTTYVEYKDWKLNETTNYLTKAQNQAAWNFYLYELDRSKAIHNPTYAAELLYDAISLLGLTQPTAWTSRP
jgi:hypothetical protein